MKIFIYSLTLFIILFNSAGIFIIENIHKRSLDRTISTVIDEHKLIEGSIYLNTDSIQDTIAMSEKQLRDWLSLVVTGYIYNDSITEDSVELLDENNNLLFSRSSLKLNGQRPEIEDAKLNERSFLIRNIDKSHYIFVSSKILLMNKSLKLVLAKNIDYIYWEREENYRLFYFLDCIILLLLAAGMYLIAKGVSKPINRLSEASKEIAHGNFSRRVSIKNSTDELGSLAENFNIMAKATEDTIEELKELNHAKQRFVDSLTHEIKTPLTSIIGYSDLLLKGNISEEIKVTALNYINSEAKRLEKLNLTLLKLILLKQEGLTLENISLKECLSNAFKSLNYKLEDKNINLKVNLQDFEIISDKQLILVLLINILDNAIKASNSNGTIEIEGRYQESFSKYILIIKDYGVGIPKEDLDKIKEPFYMVDKARDREKSGVGLGLSICEEICKSQKIMLTIKSEEDLGTEVSIHFPKEISI
ncbi:MAG: HAMP domain-containing sensor histidine kinase [Clostridium sp.]